MRTYRVHGSILVAPLTIDGLAEIQSDVLKVLICFFASSYPGGFLSTESILPKIGTGNGPGGSPRRLCTR